MGNPVTLEITSSVKSGLGTIAPTGLQTYSVDPDSLPIWNRTVTYNFIATPSASKDEGESLSRWFVNNWYFADYPFLNEQLQSDLYGQENISKIIELRDSYPAGFVEDYLVKVDFIQGYLLVSSVSPASEFNYGGEISVIDSDRQTGLFLKHSAPRITAEKQSALRHLVAYPGDGWRVKEWIGADTVYGTGGTQSSPSTTNTVLMSEDKEVKVSFEEIPSYNLTLVTNGTGILQSSPSGTIQLAGSTITLTATPGTNWSINNWEGTDDDVAAGNSSSVSIIINRDRTILVNFEADPYYLTVSQTGEGIIKSVYNGVTYFPASGEFPAGSTVSLEAIPSTDISGSALYGWRVGSWSGTQNDTSLSNFNSVELTQLSQTATVNFVAKSAPVFVNLTTGVVGEVGGSVSEPASGSYEQFSTVTITAIPEPGYVFLKWIGLDEDMTQSSSVQLQIVMTGDKSVSASFILTSDGSGIGGGGEKPLLNAFYCASDARKSHVISFDYTNTDNNSKRFHFRTTFFADENKLAVVYSAFSLVDNKRWYYDNGSTFNQIDSNGVLILPNATVTIYYDPDILPQDMIENQTDYIINAQNVTERPLVCGVPYYVDIEVSESDSYFLTFLKSEILILLCEDNKANRWRENDDLNNWICSGRGKGDLKISDTGDQSLFSSISSNIFGVFSIVWQSRRGDKYPVYGAMWDSENDKLYSSGQGLYDTLYLLKGFNPNIMTDDAQNFYISAKTKEDIYVYKCALSSEQETTSTVDTAFKAFCYPGYNSSITASQDDSLIRMYEEDTVDSLVVNRNKVVPVVDKKDIRLDINGVPGAYAVRIRDASSPTWRDWINIGVGIQVNDDRDGNGIIDQDLDRTVIDKAIDAYFIDSDRFIVSWVLPRTNGLRRVCCEVLTSYGISKTLCLDIYVNIDLLEYVVDFYISSNLSEENKVVVYNGFPVVSQIKDQNGIPILESKIYIKITFNQDQIYGDNELKFNIIQQGMADQYGLTLLRLNNREYKGFFIIYKSDGIFYKDGKGFIELDFPEDSISTSCQTDESDKYNLMINQKDLFKFIDADPEQVFERYYSGRFVKITDINSFKQYYKVDDENFKFGNPKFFKKD